jgi:mRNA interferase MazF
VQSDLLPLSTLLVAPTSASARPTDFRPAVEVNGMTTLVLVEQIAAVDPQRLGERVGRLSAREQVSVDQAIQAVFGLI